MLDYISLKKLAKENSIKVTALIALAPQNDPFYVGSPAQQTSAEWFAGLYEGMGSPLRVHVRRIHYILVSRGDVVKPNGKLYENTNNDWNMISLACKYARYLGLVPIDNFVDRRNPEPTLYAKYWENKDVESELSNLSVDEIADTISRRFWIYNPQLSQAYHLEIWCEKSTMNDIIMPSADHYNANVVTGLGELSITAVNKLVHRIQAADKPARIFYISDFDPAGETMPVSVARKIEYFSRKLEDGSDVRLKQLMLTKDQCIEYALPRTPIKDSDLRKAGFEDRRGEGATELDALEALHPGQMREIITGALDPYFDVESYNVVVSENERIRQAIKEALREKLSGIDASFEGIGDAFDMPQGELVYEGDNWLLNTELDYVRQLQKYRQHKE